MQRDEAGDRTGASTTSRKSGSSHRRKSRRPIVVGRPTVVFSAVAGSAMVLLALPPVVLAGDDPQSLPQSCTVGQAEGGVENPGFESESGWTGLSPGSAAYYAPVEGSRYAVLEGPGSTTCQETSVIVEAGTRYEVTVWARSIYDDDHTAALASKSFEGLPVVGTSAGAKVRLSLRSADVELASTHLEVSPRALTGAAATVPNDDGANVWLDGEFRVQFGDSILFQPVASDPIADPWQQLDDPTYDQDLAVGIVAIPGGPRFIFDCFYTDDPPIGGEWASLISRRAVDGTPLSYTWGTRETVLVNERQNTGAPDDQFPWVIDAHAFWDPETQRLWMSWGGHDLYVTELDPATGRAIDAAGNVVSPDLSDFDPNATDDPVHTMVVRELPEAALDDPWRRTTYQEGPAIHRNGDFYYYFATYGDLAHDYTIRVGRSTNPRGPYLDRDGTSLLDGGGTFVLGDDTEQLVPGHPHIWEESGVFYLGYDYRTTRDPSADELDLMGIRRLDWVDGWPTVWRPATASFRADDHPDAIGHPLVISIGNTGDAGSVLAVDRVSVDSIASPCPADLDGNGVVNGADIGILLIRWGTADDSADLDGNGVVNGADIGVMLVAWGTCD